MSERNIIGPGERRFIPGLLPSGVDAGSLAENVRTIEGRFRRVHAMFPLATENYQVGFYAVGSGYNSVGPVGIWLLPEEIGVARVEIYLQVMFLFGSDEWTFRVQLTEPEISAAAADWGITTVYDSVESVELDYPLYESSQLGACRLAPTNIEGRPTRDEIRNNKPHIVALTGNRLPDFSAATYPCLLWVDMHGTKAGSSAYVMSALVVSEAE
jgi:hypothetical protein